jgi:hypothetical protein
VGRLPLGMLPAVGSAKPSPSEHSDLSLSSVSTQQVVSIEAGGLQADIDGKVS